MGCHKVSMSQRTCPEVLCRVIGVNGVSVDVTGTSLGISVTGDSWCGGSILCHRGDHSSWLVQQCWKHLCQRSSVYIDVYRVALFYMTWRTTQVYSQWEGHFLFWSHIIKSRNLNLICSLICNQCSPLGPDIMINSHFLEQAMNSYMNIPIFVTN